MQVRRRRAGIVDWLRGERAAEPHPAGRLHLGGHRPGRAAAAGLRRDGAVPRGAVHQRPRCSRRIVDLLGEDRHQLTGPTDGRCEQCRATAEHVPGRDRTAAPADADPARRSERGDVQLPVRVLLADHLLVELADARLRDGRRRSPSAPAAATWRPVSARKARSASKSAVAPSLSTTVASGRSPHFSSGTATTAASATVRVGHQRVLQLDARRSTRRRT